MSKQALPKSVYEQLAEFRYTLRKFIRFSESAAREMGLTPQQHQLMLAIQGYPGRDFATVSELAERLQLTHHACVGLVTRCEQAGLVRRRPNPDDARSVHIGLTEEGLELLEKLSAVHLQQIRDLHLVLPSSEQPWD
jgi:DNA-binding MarR family transcriptional regulator